MPSNHLILCHPILLLPSIFPSIRVFSNESALHIMWPKYWSFSFTISPSNGIFRTDFLYALLYTKHYSLDSLPHYQIKIGPISLIVANYILKTKLVCPPTPPLIGYAVSNLLLKQISFYIDQFTHVRDSAALISRNETAGSKGMYICKFDKHCQIVLCKGCTNLYSHYHAWDVRLSLPSSVIKLFNLC